MALPSCFERHPAARLPPRRGMGLNHPDPAGMSTPASLLSAAGLGLLSAGGHPPLAIWPLMLIALAGLVLVLTASAAVLVGRRVVRGGHGNQPRLSA